MKKIAVIANVPSHHHYIGPLLKALDAYDVSFVAHPRLRESIAPTIDGLGSISRVIETDGDRVFTPDVVSVLENADFAILEEPFTYREMAHMAFRNIPVPFALTVHNLNSWFFPHYGMRIKQNAITVMKRLILRKTPDIIVVGSNILAHARSIGIDKNFLYVPMYYNEGKAFGRESGTDSHGIRIVIPGIVSRRRNYTRVLDVYEKSGLKDITLVLLGAPTDEYGGNILKRAKTLNDAGYHVETFEEFIPTARYEEEVSRANALLSMFDIHYRTIDRQDEVYGRTKITGAAIQALNRAKPIIVPADYNPLHEIASQVLPFDTDDDLLHILRSIAEKPGYLDEYAENAVRNAGKMSLVDTRKSLADLIERRTS